MFSRFSVLVLSFWRPILPAENGRRQKNGRKALCGDFGMGGPFKDQDPTGFDGEKSCHGSLFVKISEKLVFDNATAL